MSKLPLDEQEIVLAMSMDDPDTWYCFCNAPRLQRKLEATGAVLVREVKGNGKFYTLRANQISFRKGEKRARTEAQVAQAQKLFSPSKITE